MPNTFSPSFDAFVERATELFQSTYRHEAKEFVSDMKTAREALEKNDVEKTKELLEKWRQWAIYQTHIQDMYLGMPCLWLEDELEKILAELTRTE